MGENLFLDPSGLSTEAARIRDTSRRLKAILDEHTSPGVGFVLVVFESPMSLRRPQVALSTDHDAATVERLCAGVVDQIRGKGPA